jgi:hypothetical protein
VGRWHQLLRDQDVLGGLLCAAIGLTSLWLLRDVPLGTVRRMGSGFMPYSLAWGMVAIGALIAGLGMMRRDKAVASVPWRSMLVVLGAIAVFGLLLRWSGFTVAAVAAVSVAARAAPGFRWGEALAAGIAIAAFGALVFGGLLNLPLKLWPW